jgi:hypothetical protein
MALLALSPTITFAITLAAGFISVSPINSAAPDFGIKYDTLYQASNTFTFSPPVTLRIVFFPCIIELVLEELYWFVMAFFDFVIEVALEVG